MKHSSTYSERNPDLVLSNLEWVRALAARLVGDAASADDLVQEAWLAARATESSRTIEGNPRPWLAGVLRNLARKKHRRGAEQRAREQRAARPEATERAAAADELVSRSELLMRVGDHVLRLSEPARRTMLMRWFDGLSVEEISRREGVEPSSVRSRLHRGRTELKARLDAENGGESRSWALALMPFAPRELPSDALPSTLSLKGSLFAAGAAAVVTGTVWIGILLAEPPERQGPASLASAILERPAEVLPVKRAPTDLQSLAGGDASASGNAGARSTGLVAQEPRDELVPDRLPEADGLRGVVVLPDGTPLPGAGIFADPVDGEGKRRHVRTGDDGRFAIPRVDAEEYSLRVISNDDLAIRGSGIVCAGESEHRIVVDACMITIRAESATGEPVSMASVGLGALATEAGARGSVRRNFPEGILEERFFFPGGTGHVVVAEDAQGECYYGLLPAERAFGAVEMTVRVDAPEFGRLTIRLAHPDLPEGATLDIDSLERDGRSVSRIMDPVPVIGGVAEFELGGLLPGSYAFHADVRGARPVAVRRGPYEARVDAGVHGTVELGVTLGGIIELAVTGSPAPAERRLATTAIRLVGETEWKELILETAEAKGWMVNDSVVLGGPAGLSFPLPEGRYEIRVSAEGFAAGTAVARVLNRATERIELELDQAN